MALRVPSPDTGKGRSVGFASVDAESRPWHQAGGRESWRGRARISADAREGKLSDRPGPSKMAQIVTVAHDRRN